MEACVGAHHLSRRLKALGHDTRLMPAKYVRAFLKGNKNDYRDAEASRSDAAPTMRFVATKTAEQLDLQALHRCAPVSSASARRLPTRSAPSCSTAASPSLKACIGCEKRSPTYSPPAPTSLLRACRTSSRTSSATGDAFMGW